MGKDININTGEWCDVVFEKRNKQYGAYKLRQTSSKRHIVALGFALGLLILVMVLPSLIGVVKQLTKKENLGPMEDTFELSNIPIDKQVPQENIIKQETAPPPPPLKSTIQFVPPVIAKDEEVSDKDQMKAQDEILESKLVVSVADVKGTDDKFGIDIAELDKHKVIVEEKPVEEKPFVNVEQMPEFPGGAVEMMKWITSNLRYPVVAQENGLQGRVVVRFVVTATGNISDVQVLRGFDPSCDKEAERVVKSMPKWVPGKQNGRNVPVYFTLPVVFKLQ